MRQRIVLHCGQVTELLHGRPVPDLPSDAFVYDMRVNARGQLVLTLDAERFEEKQAEARA